MSLDAWHDMAERAKKCSVCALAETANRKVLADPTEYRGRRPIMVVGEAPGENEDLDGRPFVGRAGLLMRDHFERIGLRKRDVYVANCIQCRPPKNRDPFGHELAACRPFLLEKIRICAPEALIVVGRIAASQILAQDQFSITRQAGKEFRSAMPDAPCLPSFVILHPSYALRGHYAEFDVCMDKLGEWLREKGLAQ